ncbi:hypothetical protein BGW80DRAFT_1250829 [Lactifluus volemus]|nr:hypothetical protein BGW80DRAFT_1250829 [Lactifluus volemus]
MVSFLRPTSSHSKVTWPRHPAQLPVSKRGSSENSDSETISLRRLIETRCPSALTPFKPAWWLFNRVDLVTYDRKLLELKDGGTLGIDFTPPAKAGLVFAETTPVVVVLHGVCGAYLRNIIAPVVAPVEEGGLGYRAVAVNSRGCAGVPLSSPQFYGLSHTDDFRQAMLYIANMYPKAPLLGLGFSLVGGYLVSRLIYSKSLGTSLRNVLNRHRDSIHSFPDTDFAQAFSTLPAQSRVIGTQFDTLITIKFGGSSPPFPFPDPYAYYAYASSYNKLDRVRIPFLAFNYDDNEWVTLVVTRGGGHMGWFQSGEAEDRWARRPVLEWLRATAEDVKVIPRNVREIECRDGWLVEIGNEHLGCREIGTAARPKITLTSFFHSSSLPHPSNADLMFVTEPVYQKTETLQIGQVACKPVTWIVPNLNGRRNPVRGSFRIITNGQYLIKLDIFLIWARSGLMQMTDSKLLYRHDWQFASEIQTRVWSPGSDNLKWQVEGHSGGKEIRFGFDCRPLSNCYFYLVRRSEWTGPDSLPGLYEEMSIPHVLSVTKKPRLPEQFHLPLLRICIPVSKMDERECWTMSLRHRFPRG